MSNNEDRMWRIIGPSQETQMLEFQETLRKNRERREKERCLDNCTTRDKAIDHVVDSAMYWSSDNGNTGQSPWPCNENPNDAFKMAVKHVKEEHYNLSREDIMEAKSIFKNMMKPTD